MSKEKRTDATEPAKAASPDELVKADPEAAFELTDDQLSKVSGGSAPMNRVKTSDKQQKAVLDFVKG